MLLAADCEAVLPVHGLLRKGLKVAGRVGNVGNLGSEVPQDDALHVLEVGGEEQAGDEEGAVLLQVGVSVGLSKIHGTAIKGDTGVAVCSSLVIGKLDLDGANVASAGSGRGRQSKEGEGGGDGEAHFGEGEGFGIDFRLKDVKWVAFMVLGCLLYCCQFSERMIES